MLNVLLIVAIDAALIGAVLVVLFWLLRWQKKTPGGDSEGQ